MPLNDELKGLIGDKFTDDQIAEMLMPEVQTRLSETHVIRTKEDDESYLSSHVSQGVDAKIGARIGEIHQQYEDDIFEITGLRKKVNEKAYEFNKRLLKELKTKSDNSGGDQGLKDQIQSLTEALTQKDTEYASKLTEVQTASFKKQLEIVTSGVFDKQQIATPPHIVSDEDKLKYINNQKRLLKQDFLNTFTPKEDNEGNITFYIGDKLQVNQKDGKPLTAEELIADNYGSYFNVAESKKQGGAGSGKDGIPSNGFTTTEQIYEHLKSKGLEMMTPEFNQAAIKLKIEYGIV